jgi:acetylglutamate kinase
VGVWCGLIAADELQKVSHNLCDARRVCKQKGVNLIFCDFNLWGNLNGKVYKNNPRSIEALQNEITRVIGSVAVDELQRVSHNLFMRCEACLLAEGGRFQHLL